MRRTHLKNSSFLQLNPVALALVGVFALPSTSWAVCTPASPVTVPGTAVSCSGATAGQFLINTQNVTLTNTGTWTATGALTGVAYATHTTGSGVSVINQGSIDWSSALYGGSGTGTRAVANLGYNNGNNFTSASLLNEASANLSATISSTLAANRRISGASLYARLGLASATNRGNISLTNSSPTASSGSNGIDVLGSGATAVNSGSVLVTMTGGASGYGIGALGTAGAAQVTNTGSVTVDSALGAGAAVSFAVAAGSTAVKVTNSGLLEIKGATAASPNRAVVEFDPFVGNTIFREVENQAGGVIRADAFSYAVIMNGADTVNNPVSINNAGMIEGPILTRAGADRLIQTAGSLTGSITLGAGADTLEASGGALAGSSFMGEGDDSLTLSGSVDVSQVPQFDGGMGTDLFTLDGLTLRGFTGANNLTNGHNFTQWETIHLANAATLQLTGDLFESGAAAQLNIDPAATLSASGVPGTFTVHASAANNGSMTLADASPAADDRLVVAGNYVGASASVVALDVVLEGSASPADLLDIVGNTSGTSSLRVVNANGLGAATTGNGILVVQVGGVSSGIFTLEGGSIAVGDYVYTLHQVGKNWYLQSALIPPSISLVCSPDALTDSVGQVSTCTLTLTHPAPPEGLNGNLNLPSANPRYSTTCTQPLVVAGGATSAVCTVTATPNTVMGDGEVTADLSIAPATTLGAYEVAGALQKVLVRDDDVESTVALVPVPALDRIGLMLLALGLGAIGALCSRGKRSVRK
ncbi:pertactin-like passenger domain-containing protein [Ottowia thiooxydans]|uniref:pertactin-like passenger domain-containing protein n=1 Tax=Ottowia thiooxydans TaxID=219182 RepID=UPI000405668B|nr:pertactin-like passenger domain-containing protein [Ottowia thiooxydans]